MDFINVKAYILDLLKERLPAHLSYHRYEHTVDVYEQAKRIAASEGIQDEEQLIWLQTAALFHDTGFLNVYKEHEQEGCRIVMETLPNYGYSDVAIEAICGMIMATRIPQTPKTHLEEILADADLDYLGRPDFHPIADTLCQELILMGALQRKEDWDPLQIKFLQNHKYFTQSSIRDRDPLKLKHLEEIMARIESK
jgi:uncharacterized protein